MKHALRIITIFSAFLMGVPATQAQDVTNKETGLRLIREVRAGISEHDADAFWANDQKEEGADLNIEVIFDRPLFRFLSGTAFPNLGLSLNTRGDTSKIYAGLLHQWEFRTGFFFNTGLGIALHSGEMDDEDRDKKALGARILFRIPLEIGYALDEKHRLSIAFDHISNADLASPNPGMDTLGFFYGYRF